MEHIKRQDKIPAVGTYDPQSPKTQIEIDFSKAPARWDPIKEEWEREMDKDGDVLILDPQRPGKRLPDIIFDKQIGRKEEMKVDDDIAGKDELILEPNIDVIRRRRTYLVTDFNKQIGRKEVGDNDPTKDEYFIAVGDEEEKLADPSAKRQIVYDFGKPKQRDEK